VLTPPPPHDSGAPGDGRAPPKDGGGKIPPTDSGASESGDASCAASETSHCFAKPGACCYPDPAYHNVGATSACSSLTPSGSITVSTAGATIKDMNVTGQITISAPNVTLSNVCVTYNGHGAIGSAAVTVAASATSVLIEDSTIAGANQSTESMEIAVINQGASGARLLRDYLYNCGECIHDTPWTVEDSYVITNGMQGTTDHVEDVYFSDGTITLVHNTLLNPWDQTATVFGDTNEGGGGPCDNQLTMTNNLVAGGGLLIYTCGNASSVGSSVMSISDNRFARCTTPPLAFNSGTGGETCQGSTGSSIGSGADSNGYWARGGYFGLLLSTYCPPASGQVWSGNVWDDDGESVTCMDAPP
jgi:hypothetical protein